MAFSGDLEYLSIVDVIQLLHTTRKTGTLKVQGKKGEIAVAFNDGFIVGANHYSRGALIGHILTEAGVVTQEALQQGLEIQQKAGDARKPLIATLLENGLADRDAAYRALEALIELAIVEILTWKKGSFALEADQIHICDEFKYFPDSLQEEITLPTEHVLLDALRIFDEKMRDGLLQMEDDTVAAVTPEPAASVDAGSALISADDLGLGDLDAIKPKLPAFHEALRDQQTAEQLHEQKLTKVLKESTARMIKATTLPETSLILLETVASHFPRALTLVVWDKELVAERGIGINAPRQSGPGAVLGFKLPVEPGSLFSFVLEKGLPFCGKSQDRCLHEHLYAAIGAPVDPTVMLLPLKLGKRIVAITYADFGSLPAVEIPAAKLEGLAEHAGMVIEGVMLRKQQQAAATH